MRRLDFRTLLERKRDELEAVLYSEEPHGSTQNQFLARLHRGSGERARHQLERITEALERFANDDFGVCQSCGEKISERELLLRPERKICEGCGRKTEATV